MLTREEAEALGREAPQPFWLSIDLLIMDRARQRALVIWTHGGNGGTLLLDQQPGGWHSEVRSRWIS